MPETSLMKRTIKTKQNLRAGVIFAKIWGRYNFNCYIKNILHFLYFMYIILHIIVYYIFLYYIYIKFYYFLYKKI